MLSDLRESGSIEQDADQVMFLYRGEYYGFEQDEEGNPCQGVGEVIIAKNRHGSTANVRLRFIGEYAKFANLEEFSYNDESTMPVIADEGGFIKRGSAMNDEEDDPLDTPF